MARNSLTLKILVAMISTSSLLTSGCLSPTVAASKSSKNAGADATSGDSSGDSSGGSDSSDGGGGSDSGETAQAPVLSAITDLSLAVNGSGSVNVGISDSDTTLDCSNTYVTFSSSNTTLLPNANITLGGTSPTCTLAIAPTAGESGSSTVTVTLSDGSLTDSEAFTVTVGAASDPPSIQAINDTSTNEDTNKVIDFDVSDSDTTINCTTMLSMTSSSTSIVANAGVTWSTVTPYASGVATCRATIAPVANAHGSTNLTFTADDGSATDTEVLTLTVNSVNDAPSISAISDTSTNEDTSKNVDITITDVDTTINCATMLSMSSDDTAVVASNAVTWSTVSAYSSGSATCRAAISPVSNATGTANLTITVDDGSATDDDTFALTVNAVNDAPTISDTSNTSTNEDSSKTIDVTVTDNDTTINCATMMSATSGTTSVVANAGITWSTQSAYASGSATCRATIAPVANANGTSTITFTVNDGSASANDSFVLTVNAVNDAPSLAAISDDAINEDSTESVDLTITDPDTTINCATMLSLSSDTTSVVANSGVAWSTVSAYASGSATCRATVSPVANANGTANITITVNDGSASASDTYTLTVVAINDAPTISDTANTSTNEDTSATIDVTITDVDTTINCATMMSGTSGTTSVVANAGITWSTQSAYASGSATCRATLAPVADANGTSTITFTVNDGTDTASDSFVLTVTAVNDAPTISNISNQTTPVSTATSAISFTIGDVETAAASLTVSGSSSNTSIVPNAGITFGGSGSSRTVTVTPGSTAGSATITITVSDGSASTNTTFSVSVQSPSWHKLVAGGSMTSDRSHCYKNTSGVYCITTKATSATNLIVRTQSNGTQNVYNGPTGMSGTFGWALGIGGDDTYLVVSGGANTLFNGGWIAYASLPSLTSWTLIYNLSTSPYYYLFSGTHDPWGSNQWGAAMYYNNNGGSDGYYSGSVAQSPAAFASASWLGQSFRGEISACKVSSTFYFTAFSQSTGYACDLEAFGVSNTPAQLFNASSMCLGAGTRYSRPCMTNGTQGVATFWDATNSQTQIIMRNSAGASGTSGGSGNTQVISSVDLRPGFYYNLDSAGSAMWMLSTTGVAYKSTGGNFADAAGTTYDITLTGGDTITSCLLGNDYDSSGTSSDPVCFTKGGDVWYYGY